MTSLRPKEAMPRAMPRSLATRTKVRKHMRSHTSRSHRPVTSSGFTFCLYAWMLRTVLSKSHATSFTDGTSQASTSAESAGSRGSVLTVLTVLTVLMVLTCAGNGRAGASMASLISAVVCGRADGDRFDPRTSVFGRAGLSTTRLKSSADVWSCDGAGIDSAGS